MTAEKNAAKKLLAAALSLSLLAGSPTAAFAQHQAAASARAASGVSAGARVAILPKMDFTTARPLGVVPQLPTKLSPVDGPARALPTTPAVAAVAKLDAAGVTLPDTHETWADAAGLRAVGGELSGPVVSELEKTAGGIETAARAGWDRSIGEGTKLFDGAQARGESAVPASAVSRWLSAASRLIPSGLRRVAAPQPQPQPQAEPAKPVSPDSLAVTPSSLRYVPSPALLPRSTSEVPTAQERVVGQDAALKALKFGVKMQGRHYNLFVSGPNGSGRETALRQLLKEVAPTLPTSNGVVAVTNFEDNDQPIFLELPAGRETAFAKAIKKFVKTLKVTVPKAVMGGKVGQKISEIEKAHEARMAKFGEHVNGIKLANGFGVRFLYGEVEQGVVVLVTLDHNNVMIRPTDVGEIHAKVFAEQLAAATPAEELIAKGAFTAEQLKQAQAEAGPVQEELIKRFKALRKESGAEQQMAAMQAAGLASSAVMAAIDDAAKSVAASVVGTDDSASKDLNGQIEALIAETNEKLAKNNIDGVSIGLVLVGKEIGAGLMRDGKVLEKKEMMALIGSGFNLAELNSRFGEANNAITAEFGEKRAALIAAYKARKADAAQIVAITKEQKAALDYVEKMSAFAKEHFQLFLKDAAEESGEPAKLPNGMMEAPGQKPIDVADFFQASVIKKKSPNEGATVIWDMNPSYESMFGEADDNRRTLIVPGAGMMKTGAPGGPSFKPGNIHKADILVVDAMAALRAPGVWHGIMQMVRSGTAEVADGGLKALVNGRSGGFYKVPNKVKIVLVGSPSLRMLLSHYEEDFRPNFQSVAEFQPTLEINDLSVAGTVQFLSNAVVNIAAALNDTVRHLTQDAISAVIEISARKSGGHDKLSAKFGELYGVVQEATFWAKEAGRDVVTREDVDTALKTKREREEIYREKLLDVYKKNVFAVETAGKKVGQVNGLAVMGSFGVPMRITVVDYAAAGPGGIVSIDRQADTTGSSFNKALGVAEGFLQNLFARSRAFPARLSLSYEQNYGGIDGDSATTTEIYAMLSALSGVPLEQSFAMTGSADQFGNVQAIGGVNEKIEGFYELVKARGAGDYSVMIPKTNVADLQLDPEIVGAHQAAEFKSKFPLAAATLKSGASTGIASDAMAAFSALSPTAQESVRAGRFFRIYAIGHISEGVELLTGVAYSEVLAKARERLEEIRNAGKAPAATPAAKQ